LPVDQFAKSATNVRKQQQGQATTTAQGQMNPMSKLPTDQFNKSAANVRKNKQATALKPVRKPKDNSIKFPKKNKPVPTPPAGNQAFGQMAQNLSKVAEGNRFYKLNYIFESILAEQDPEQGTTKQSISQYITNFFTLFMKNVDIDDPTVKTQIASLAKELEQTYAKDKGRTTLPKLANLAYSVSYSQDPEAARNREIAKADEKAKKVKAEDDAAKLAKAEAAKKDKAEADAAKAAKLVATGTTQKAKTPLQQIEDLIKDLTPTSKERVIRSLQKGLPTSAKKSSVNTSKIKGAKQGGPTPDEEAKLQQLIQKAQANQK
jgi:hypothetical protein